MATSPFTADAEPSALTGSGRGSAAPDPGNRAAFAAPDPRGDRGFTVTGAVAIIGLGLIGGSIARDLRAMGIEVLGYDRLPASSSGALEASAISRVLSEDLAGIEEADVILVATPVDETRGVLREIDRRKALSGLKARLITDVGSTKRSVLDAARASGISGIFVGSHPMAGDHRSGWPASRSGMFSGARVFACKSPDTTEAASTLTEEFWRLFGARVEWIDAGAHDEMLAWSSHLPQVTATALALALDENGVSRALLGPGGRDTTRLAGSSPDLWTSIVRDNAGSLASALERLEEELRNMRTDLLGDDESRLRARFASARDWFAQDIPEGREDEPQPHGRRE